MLTKPAGIIASAVIGLQLLVSPALAQQNEDRPHPPPLGTASYTPAPGVKEQPLTSETFAVRAAAVNLAEIELGQLARSKSESAPTREFAQRMLNDHRAAMTKLKAVAAEEKISLPATMDEQHRAMKQQLSQLAGDEFDRQYIDAMARGHAEAIALFEAAAFSPKVSAAFRRYANEALPTLKQHGEAAQSLRGEKAR